MGKIKAKAESSTETTTNEPPPKRCVSPIPASVALRLRNNNYTRFVKPCKAPMFRFFMEQHIEKLIQQYRERNQRAIQVIKKLLVKRDYYFFKFF